jgi:transposase-like protein
LNQRVKHSTETRIEAARLFDAGFGVSAVATHMQIPKDTLRDWLDAHRQGRLIKLADMDIYRNYSTALKVAAVEKFLAGTSKAEILLEFGISNRSVFNKWVAAFRKDGVTGLAAKPKGRKPAVVAPVAQTLEERVLFLEMENEVLKKLHALMDQDLALNKKR